MNQADFFHIDIYKKELKWTSFYAIMKMLNCTLMTKINLIKQYISQGG